MKQIYPVYPSYIDVKYMSNCDLFSAEDNYILTNPLFEDYKYGKEYLVLKESYFKITNMKNSLVRGLKQLW